MQRAACGDSEPPCRGRVMIVEDDVAVAEDLRTNLQAWGYTVVGHASEGHQAVAMARQRSPRLILMDIQLSDDFDGIAAALEIKGAMDAAVVFLTGHTDDATLARASRARPFAFIVKPFHARQVASCVALALAEPVPPGRAVIRPADTESGPVLRFRSELRRLRALRGGDLRWLSALERRGPDEVRLSESISAREKEIVVGLICWRRLSTVAEVLDLSIHTARNHLKSVFRKLGVHSQDELFRLVLASGSCVLRRHVPKARRTPRLPAHGPRR